MTGVGGYSPPWDHLGDHDKGGSPLNSSGRSQRATFQDISREAVLASAVQTANEASPLLSPQNSVDTGSVAGPNVTLGGSGLSVPNRSTLYLAILTLSIGGLQISWAVQLSNGSPYLLSLGLSKSLMALVWIAGPLSGTLVQPYIGIRSDKSRIRWGKRRPFMIVSGLVAIISLLTLAWSRELVRWIMGIFGAKPESKAVMNAIIVVTVFFVYVLYFAINAVEAATRAFIVDNAPTHQQDLANAWAGRMIGVGNVLGYLSGYVNLPKAIPFFGNTQFKVLCAIASVALGSTLTISCLYVKERDPREEGPPAPEKGGVIGFFKQVFKSIGRLPPQIKSICAVQFFAWIGWFPFLFYITTYIGEIYVTPLLRRNPSLAKDQDQVDKLWEEATRIGTLALLIFAITSFLSNIFLPLFVAPSCLNSKALHRSILSKFAIRWLTLRRAWLSSHVLFAGAMWLTFFVRNTWQATLLVGFVGISWALTLWAPYALISAEISKRETVRRSHLQDTSRPHPHRDGGEDQAGVILGLHNVATAAPQVIATLGSSFVFGLSQKKRGESSDDSVGWVLRLGGLAALIAAWMTTKVAEEDEMDEAPEGFLPIVNNEREARVLTYGR